MRHSAAAITARKFTETEKLARKTTAFLHNVSIVKITTRKSFGNNVDLRKAEKQLYELILSFYLSGKYQYHYHSWIKLLEGSNQASRTSQSQYLNHPVRGSNQTPQTLQSWHVNHPVQGSNQTPETLQSRHVNYPEQGSNRTAGTMNMNVWNRIQSTPIFAIFFGCFSCHRPVTRNKGSYNKYNRLTTAFSLKLICFVVQEKKICR